MSRGKIFTSPLKIIGRFYIILNKMNGAKIPIIYQDSEIFIINKRQGLSTQGGAGVSHSVDSDLAAQVGQKIYLVHRLDKETSGLLICAKNPAAASKWTKLVGEKSVVKEYKALCVGVPKNPRGKINSAVMDKGVQKRAETFYEVEKTFQIAAPSDEACAASTSNSSSTSRAPSMPNGASNYSPLTINHSPLTIHYSLSLLHLTLGTGRTHQLRIHLAREGYPICGDDKHGDFKMNKILKKATGIKRLCLCAFRLTVPINGAPRVFEIPCEFF